MVAANKTNKIGSTKSRIARTRDGIHQEAKRTGHNVRKMMEHKSLHGQIRATNQPPGTNKPTGRRNAIRAMGKGKLRDGAPRQEAIL